MARPYRSPLGVAGAAIAACIAAATLFTLFLNRDYKTGVIGAALWFLLGIGYFAVHGRKGLVLAPEERLRGGARDGMGSYRHTIGQTTYCFADLKGLLAKASPLRSGDELAGIAARSRRRTRARRRWRWPICR